MRKLIRGIVEFRNSVLPAYRDKFAKLALGQKPDALFIACSDSRVVPNLFASTNPGDLFVIRNVGNFVPLANSKNAAAEGAAIEFSTEFLKVKDIVVCGHSECGACQALLSTPTIPAPHLKSWLQNGAEAVSMFKTGQAPDPNLSPHDQVSQLNTLLQLERLKSYPSVRERFEKKKIGLHAWWFDIKTGDVYAYEPELNRFVVIDEAEAERLMTRIRN